VLQTLKVFFTHQIKKANTNSATQNNRKCLGLAQLLMENLKVSENRRSSVQTPIENHKQIMKKPITNDSSKKYERNNEKNKLMMMLTMAKNQEIPNTSMRKSIENAGNLKLDQRKKSCTYVAQNISNNYTMATTTTNKSKNSMISVTEAKPLKSAGNDMIITQKESKISDYNMGGQIGQGAYGVVKSGVHKPTGRKVAIKVYEKYKIADSQRKTCVNREIKILKKLSHTNIVQLYETIDTTKQLFIIMELVKGRSLHSYLHCKQNRKLDEAECMKLFSQIAAGIDYCHKNYIVHRDIKMENILLDEHHNVKIIDFGFSICADKNQKLKIFCGTPSYMAPEIVNKKEYLGQPTDVWSLGILLYAMLCGSFPFRGSTEHELFRCISKCQYKFPDFVSNTAKGIVNKMLCLNPEKRASAEQIYKETSALCQGFKGEISNGLCAMGINLKNAAEENIEKKIKSDYDKEIIEKVARLGYSYFKIAQELKEKKGPAYDAFQNFIKAKK